MSSLRLGETNRLSGDGVNRGDGSPKRINPRL
jgi:hypothetical protein